jgi:cell division septation protein DedD
MLSIFSTEPATDHMPVHFEDAQPVVEDSHPDELAEPDDFEIVLGRRQLASVLFVATVVIAVFSSLAYLTGKSLAAAPKTIEKTVEVIRTVQVPVVETPLEAPAVERAAPTKSEPPLFANPQQGPLYLQMGAVEKGIAVIFVEGLRMRGFDAFVAPGPNENIFRVLIGPLPDERAFLKAKNAADQIGLGTFARRYQQQ